MSYSRESRTVYLHRYHIVWITRYRYKVLEGALRERIRVIIRQVCDELGVQIVSGVLSKEHVHMFVEIPPRIAVSDFVKRVKRRSSQACRWSFPIYGSGTGAGTSGRKGISVPRAAISVSVREQMASTRSTLTRADSG
jgi:putative transposase